ncbi:MAG: Txe/YoeB family addiction module toxin [Bacteroidaceae bacterium]
MKYEIELTELALDGIKILKKSGDHQVLKKLNKLLIELEEHPTMGTGQIEQLKGDKSGLWSRRITRKHRLIYSVNDSEIKVLVISTYGHYEGR